MKSSSLLNAKQENVEALINFIRRTSTSEICSVKVTKRDMVVPKNETVVVLWPANTGPVKSRLLVLFEPDVESPWPQGLKVLETLVTIQVTNTTDRDITLKNRTVLGKVQLVKSVTPLEVRNRENKESSEDCVLSSEKSPKEEESHGMPDVLAMEDCRSCGLFPETCQKTRRLW